LRGGRACSKIVRQYQLEHPRVKSVADPKFAGGVGGLSIPGVEAELKVDRIKKASFLSVRHDEFGAQFGPVNQKAPIAGPRVHRRIRAEFQLIGDAQGPFGDTLQGAVRRNAAHEIGPLATDRGVVVVQLQGEYSRIVDLGVTDLDLVGLSVRGR